MSMEQKADEGSLELSGQRGVKAVEDSSSPLRTLPP